MSKQGKLRRAVARVIACAVAACLSSSGYASSSGTVAIAGSRGPFLRGSNSTSNVVINVGTLTVLANGGATILDYNADVLADGKSSQARTVEIEQNYLQRVLQRQIDTAGFDINPEALKALAVADRSLVYRALEKKNWIGSGGDAPVYKSNIPITSAARAAEQATEHEVLLNKGDTFVNGLAKRGTRPADLASATATDFTLSLNGADFLADHGFNYLEILHFYYGSSKQLKLGTLQNPFAASPRPVYFSAGRKILADFEHDEGIFQSAGAPDRSDKYVASTNTDMAMRSFKSPLNGKASEQISIDYNERANGKPFVYRLASGVSGGEGTEQGNLLLPAKGEIGFCLRTKTPNLKAQIALNDSDRVEHSIAKRIVADDKWHKYVWDITNDHNWKGKGGHVNGPFALNSLYLTGTSDATVHIDNVFFNDLPNGSASSGGALTKVGSGTLTLVGSNNYTGGVTVNTGTVAISSGGVGTFSPVIVSGSGMLDLTATTITGSSVITLRPNNCFNGSSLVSYATAPWIVGSGTLLLGGGTFGGGGVLLMNSGSVLLSDISLAPQFAALAQPSGIPGTVLVPEPSAIGLLVATSALLHRRRKSQI